MSLVNIRILVDAAGALEARSLSGHLYMIDDNRLAGSQDQNTGRLATAVAPGDRIVWTLLPIECETHAAIHTVEVPADFCEVQRHTYPGSDVSYWTGLVKQPVGSLPYGLQVEVGSEAYTLGNGAASRLIDASTQPASQPAAQGEHHA